MKERHYFKIDKTDVQFASSKMNTIKLTKQNVKHRGIASRYNIWADPNLGLAKIVVRRIPCACAQCIEQLQKPWQLNTPFSQQPRYKQNKTCEKWEIFEGENDWELAEIEHTNAQQQEEAFQDVAQLVQADREDLVTLNVGKGKYGALMVDREGPPFDIFMFDSDPYKFTTEGCKSDSDMHFQPKEGEMVADVTFFAPLSGNWYVPTTKSGVVKMCQVVQSGIELLPMCGEENRFLPGGHPRMNPPLKKPTPQKGKETNCLARRAT